MHKKQCKSNRRKKDHIFSIVLRLPKDKGDYLRGESIGTRLLSKVYLTEEYKASKFIRSNVITLDIYAVYTKRLSIPDYLQIVMNGDPELDCLETIFTTLWHKESSNIVFNIHDIDGMTKYTLDIIDDQKIKDYFKADFMYVPLDNVEMRRIEEEIRLEI